MFSKQFKQFSTNVGCDMLAVWWIEPFDVLFSCFPFDGASVADLLQCTNAFVLKHCFLYKDSFGKFLLIHKS